MSLKIYRNIKTINIYNKKYKYEKIAHKIY